MAKCIRHWLPPRHLVRVPPSSSESEVRVKNVIESILKEKEGYALCLLKQTRNWSPWQLIEQDEPEPVLIFGKS